MQYPGFIAPTGKSRSDRMSPERCINLYIEPLPNTKQAILYSMPGLLEVAELPSAPIRALYETTTGRVFAVTSSQLFEIFAGWTFTLRGSVPSGTSVVSMTDNGAQLLLSVNELGLLYDLEANTLVPVIPDDVSLRFGRVQYIDGYFITNDVGTRRFWYSALLNGLSWDALAYYAAEGRADIILTIYTDHREIWIPGTQSIEVWFSTGDFNNPFQRMSGVFIEQGIAGPWCFTSLDNTLFALGGTPHGQGPAWIFQGYQPQHISTNSLESTLSTLPTLADTVTFSARHGSHAWFGLWFPEAETTWIYDTLTSAWTELAALAPDGSLAPFPAHQHCMAFGVHLWGNAYDGTLAVWHPGTHTYYGRPRYCERTGPFLRDDEAGSPITFSSFQLQCLVGQAEPATEPHYRLSWTADGDTWSYEHVRSSGRIGQRERRVTWRQLGQDYERAFRVVSTDPVLHAWRGVVLNG